MKKKLHNKLSLKKETLKNLSIIEMNSLRGGGSNSCLTDCFSNIATVDCGSVLCTASLNCSGAVTGPATVCYCE
jgi:natural product precursor